MFSTENFNRFLFELLLFLRFDLQVNVEFCRLAAKQGESHRIGAIRAGTLSIGGLRIK